MWIFRKSGSTARRLRKLLARLYTPDAADNAGVLLPVRDALISPHIQQEIARGGYESREIEIIELRIESGDVVMEVGAGIGFLSAWCAKKVGDGRVFAYEANPALMPLIARTYRINGVNPAARNVLLGRGNGEREFHLEPEFWASSVHRTSETTDSVLVRQIDLNEELARVNPTFLVVDIEGGEGEFFDYARLDGVRKICVEMHPHVIGSARISALLGKLFDQGFVLDCAILRKNVMYLYRPAAAD